VHLSGVDDRAQPQHARLVGRGDAVVVRGEQASEDRDQPAEQQRLGEFIRGPQQDQYPVAAVGEQIVVLAADPGHVESLHHEPVGLLAQLFLDWVSPPRAALDIDGQDAPVHRERLPAVWALAISLQCVTVCRDKVGGAPDVGQDLRRRYRVGRLGGRQGDTQHSRLEEGSRRVAAA
jgi:hypothetical protein